MKTRPHCLLVTSILLAACGAPGPAPATSADAGDDPPDLRGRWESGCVPDGERGLSLAFDIDDATWALDYATFGDAACASPFLTVHIDGPYEVGAPSSSVPGAHEARFGFAHKTVTPHGEAAAGFLASESGCGGGTFEDGAPSDVLATGCAGLGQRPGASCGADYDLVSIDAEGRLHFGQRPADNDMCTPERRPTALSPLGLRRG